MTGQKTNLGSVVFGLGVMTVGGLFLMDNLGLADAGEFLPAWPTVLILIGIADLLQRRFLAGSVWLLAGSILLAHNFGFSDIEVWDLWGLWPLCIVAIGINLIRQSMTVHPKDSIDDPFATFRMYALMGANVRRNDSQGFLGGDIGAVMGGSEIDLRNAKMAGDEAVIDAFAFWGGVEIHVPKEWVVVDRVTPILGAFENKTSPSKTASKRLLVRGTSVMGGIEVKN